MTSARNVDDLSASSSSAMPRESQHLVSECKHAVSSDMFNIYSSYVFSTKIAKIFDFGTYIVVHLAM